MRLLLSGLTLLVAAGYFRWLGAPNPGTGATGEQTSGSWAVQVTRTASTWYLRTPSPSEPWSQPGTPPVDFTAGDLNLLLKDAPRNTLTPVGLYHMPFGLTVTCTTCP